MARPLSTNKIVQCLSTSFKPKTGREEPLSIYGSAQLTLKQTSLGPSSEILLTEPGPNNLFCHTPKSEHMATGCLL